MTQKSLSRRHRDYMKKQRDEQTKLLEQNKDAIIDSQGNVWDTLNDLNTQCLTSLATTARIGKIINDKELLAAVPDKETFAVNARQLVNDLTRLKSEAISIGELHKHRTGELTDADVISLEFMEISEKYAQWNTQAEALVTPTVMVLLEQVGEAEQTLRAKNGGKLNPDSGLVQAAAEIFPESEHGRQILNKVTDIVTGTVEEAPTTADDAAGEQAAQES